VTSPIAQAGASMYQHYLPKPTGKHVQQLNVFLAQLKSEYIALHYASGFELSNCKLLVLGDSSLGNADKYSQGGHLVFLSEDLKGKAGGHVLLLSNRSGRSKRVASSTLSAETLAMTGGVEEATLLQTWLFELMHGNLSARELLSLEADQLMPIDTGTDCNDLYEILVKAAAPAPTNKALTLYLSALRSDKEQGRIRSWLWIDTRDMLANCMTKIESDGQLAWLDLRRTMLSGYWQPSHVWKWNSLDMKPAAPIVSEYKKQLRPNSQTLYLFPDKSGGRTRNTEYYEIHSDSD